MVNDFKPFTIFAKILHRRCSTGFSIRLWTLLEYTDQTKFLLLCCRWKSLYLLYQNSPSGQWHVLKFVFSLNLVTMSSGQLQTASWYWFGVHIWLQSPLFSEHCEETESLKESLRLQTEWIFRTSSDLFYVRVENNGSKVEIFTKMNLIVVRVTE